MKTAIVTGANRGIGLEACRQLAMRGFEVILTARDAEKGKAAAENLNKTGHAVRFHQLDVTDEKSMGTLASFIDGAFGKVDVLVNNAGISIGHQSITRALMEEIRLTMETNFFGPMMLTRTLLPLLKKSEDARVINVSSGMGQWKSLDAGYAGYRLSKVALNALTVMFANDLRNTNVKIYTMSPGWVKTDMGGRGAPDSLEEGADTIIWLSTEENVPSGKFYSDRQEISF